jgi:uncharacterized phage protein (TIGR01671 family)
MRKILFKAKKCGTGKWLFGNVAGYDRIVCLLTETIDDGRTYIRYCKPETVCQYTGIKDANGERIFEGDIVVINDGATQCEYVVIYETCGFKLKSSSGNIFTDYFYQRSGHLNVIGNIHDKKEKP